ncbi:MAG: efflux RND transporter periplasmic adaptor subunit [Planctomycetota bacterium]
MKSTALFLSMILLALGTSSEHAFPTRDLPRGIGLVVAERSAKISAEIDSRIVQRLVREHRPVKKGQVIFRLDNRLKKADLKAAGAGVSDAKARLELSRSELVRAKRLSRSDVSSASELDRAGAEEKRANASLSRAEAEFDRAQFAFEKATVTAPFDGVINSLLAETYEYVVRGQVLFSMVAVDELKIECHVDAHALRQLEANSKSIILDLPSSPKVKIRSIAPGSDNAARTFKVVLDVPAALASGKRRLRPGMTVGWICGGR